MYPFWLPFWGQFGAQVGAIFRLENQSDLDKVSDTLLNAFKKQSNLVRMF